MTNPLRTRLPRLLAGALLLLTAAAAAAQSVTVTPLLGGLDCPDLLAAEGRLFGATAAGGLLVWDPTDPAGPAVWTTADGLTSNRLTNLAWTGRFLWAATDGGGLTRLELTASGPVARQFARAEALAVAAVAGYVSGGTERVYYGLVDGGLGVINNGFAGDIYTSNGFPGLVDDRIRALALDGDDLWIGTADGISLFRQSLLQDRSAGLADRTVRALLAVPGLGVAAATGDGVRVWDEGAGAWSPLGADLGPVGDLVLVDGALWALREGSGTADRLLRWDGAAWLAAAAPLAGVRSLAAVGGTLWAAGSRLGPDGSPKTAGVFLADRAATGEWNVRSPDAPFFNGVDGVEITADGTLWLGARNAAGWAGWDGSTWTQYLELATVDNDSLGLINHDSGLLTMDRAPDGTVWMSQFQGGGLLRFRPDLPDVEQITPDNSALSNFRIIRLMVHPDGPVFCLSDRFGVDVLIDPERWRDPASWIVLPTDGGGLGGLKFRDAAVTRRDRIWFTSDDGGLVLWDPNGGAGPDADLTLDDASDDWWSGPVGLAEGVTYDFRGCKGLAAAADGTLWAAGGSGAIHVALVGEGPGALNLEVLGVYREMVDPSLPGLLRGVLNDVDIDRNGDVWVCHDAGLNRIRERGDEDFIDGFTNAGAFAAFGLGSLFSASVIVGVPEGTVRELAASPDGRRLLMGGDFGAAVLDIGGGSGLDQGPLETAYLHPNPYRPDHHAEGVRAAGFDGTVTVEELGIVGGALVEVYNAEGQLVYRDRNVGTDEVFWEGRNLLGDAAAPGVYVVRLEMRGHVVTRPLAVVR